MLCDVCGAKGHVLATRAGPSGSKLRLRLCARGHRYTTYEIHEPAFLNAGPRISQYAEARTRRNALWHRDSLISSDTRSSTVVGKQHGISPSRVRQIRRNHI